MRGLQWFLASVGYHLNLITSDSAYGLPVWIPMWLKKNEVKHLAIKHIYSVCLFANHLIAAEYMNKNQPAT